MSHGNLFLTKIGLGNFRKVVIDKIKEYDIIFVSRPRLQWAFCMVSSYLPLTFNHSISYYCDSDGIEYTFLLKNISHAI